MEEYKKELLERHNFKELFDHDLYYNKDSKTVISREWLEDSVDSDIERILGEKREKNTWLFYSAVPLKEEALEKLRKKLHIEISIENIFLFNP